MGLLQDLKERILIGDGAMGTLLYSYGIDRCFEELNVSKPEEIKRIHKAYVEAGADIIQTNTYGANFIKLSRYGLEDETKKINQEAVRIARASSDGAYVLGTMGGIRTFNKNAYSLEEIKRSFREQLYLLLHEEPDGLLLETYYDLEEAREVLKIARKETELPIMLNVSMHEQGVLQDGTPLREALRSIADLGADITGINCRLGPYHMIEALTEVPIFRDAYLSVYPNSSLPSLEEGRLVYDTNDAYFRDSAVQFRTQGARIIGGCCGTTPNHIRAMAEAVRGLSPVTDKEVKIRREEEVISVRNERTEPGLNEIAAQKRSIIVELDPPKKLNFDKFLQAAAELKETGIEALTLADNSLATPRISNAACGSVLKERLDIRSLVHITCRDRNIIGLQSHLMGLDTLGLTDILAITGDPSKIGDFPGATSVYDLTSFDLIRLIKQFNEGISLSGKPLGKKTNFSVAGAFNPNVRHLDKAVKRLEKKIECGADYFVSQPVYSEQQLIDIHHETKHLKTPVYIGIMPLTSSRNAEFIHHEIPGIKLSDSIREKMALAGEDKRKQKAEGLAIAKSLLDTACELFNGIYLITPFLRSDLTSELAAYIKQKDEKRADVYLH
ncbi:bifunctional homocysteine S-methyltransferase/methylenetetrahydrofolate reductase [Bacillus amyloliquefaciens]|jgi:methionine synthase I (cobalamin-dependent)/5,10-methylenetetrahydrofolate reductase|uniref:bifunctional homocysteine S-methyltransferase/methylenetetrahydrofolate reductase n=1 Tax=Bacillus amyloliquefaciens TaxID=1390 RepID=UPI0015810F45|nr:bifunctional homocysteine S-methyltransferase/methylenetetrahydrofolate reductase [Bacillus amyloliquefaciens]NUI24067.1 bifunctional homocysteine S-methyltransferase/methylenetetrahydrofolate reductase [Bacillus amyloliquefaciens]NUI33054.1 bifunctional homocysteine S-methyltransferase/methylenetetrahydrofolate reductase [Bacillus amyloliquefaciens]NUI36760.1 bifunctional homocysteine S-methyltransferase/methylenetetrahydrofolate reductase [Bacillus amyloliquefaciens]NUI70529.1 bifunctional